LNGKLDDEGGAVELNGKLDDDGTAELDDELDDE